MLRGIFGCGCFVVGRQSTAPIFADIGGIVNHINILFMSENYRANKGNNKITKLRTSQ
jgi:hypothetical protein